MNENHLKWLIHTALSYLGTPYKWVGDDPSGFDCSGFVLECLKTIGKINERDDFTANSLLQHFNDKQSLNKPEEGALLFYLDKNNHAYHVAICLDEKFQIGASGGNKTTFTPKNAWNQNAYIKIRPIPKLSKRMKLVRVI